MTTALGEAQVLVRATLDKLDGDLENARSKITGAIGGIGKNLQTVGKVAFAGILAGVAAVGVGFGLVASQAIPAASNLNEALNATSVVFGEAAGIVQEFGRTAADAAGMSAAEFNQMAAQSGAMLQNYGLSAQEAAQASIDLGTRAADMASIFNTDVADAMTAINAAMRGEADPIERFGVSMNAAAVEAQALAMGFEKVGGAFDAAALTQARLALLMEQTDKIAGDFVNTSDQLANATRVNQARWQNFMAQLGQVGLPIMNLIQGVLMDVGEKVFPIVTDALTKIQPVVEAVATAFGGFVEALLNGASPMDALRTLITDVGAAFGLSKESVAGTATAVTGVIEQVQEFIGQVQAIFEPVTTWISQNVELQDVLTTLAIILGATLLPVVVSLITTMLPLIATVGLVLGAVVLLRTAWEENWGGIQEKVAQVWAIIQPLLQQAWDWLQVNVPAALETLRAFWVDTAWPAIQGAIEAVWPIVEQIFGALKDWVINSLIPTVESLYSQWTTVWWPAIQGALEIAWSVIEPIFSTLRDWVVNTLIPTVVDLYNQWKSNWETIQTVLSNVWTVILGVWEELGRWINDNIVPWIEYLQEVWSDTVWPAIQSAVEDAWAVLLPIWQDLKTWFDDTLPPIIEDLGGYFETAMGVIDAAVKPVKAIWKDFVDAVTNFWNWISSTVFTFTIDLPDLPPWAIPGSPLPIHTAWKNFASEMAHTVIRPRIDLDAMPAAALSLSAEDGGVANQTTHNYYLQANYGYQSERSLLDDVRLAEMMHA